MRNRNFSLEEVYGVGEKPLNECPTFVERDIHNQFKYCVESEEVHIIVYGASRQGKTWMVERYCPNFIRVGCDIKFTRNQIFKAILSELGIKVGEVTNDKGNEFNTEVGIEAKGSVKVPLLVKGEVKANGKINMGHHSGEGLSYINIDLDNHTEVISAIKNSIKDKFIVIENFHYLNNSVQKEFASSLREFLYHKIRVIIVGVWKETTKIASYVSDLSNRCEYIDIGDWLRPDLIKVVEKGNIAMNTAISDEVINLFIDNSGYNIGDFKSLLKNYYKIYGIHGTIIGNERMLDDIEIANASIEKSYKELIIPVLERIESLATQKKSGSKGMRYYIVKAILAIIDNTSSENLLNGIPFQDICNEVNAYEGIYFDTGNIKQELLQLHLREETGKANKGMNTNLIPLFYFDRSKNNGKLFILESALIAAKNHHGVKLNEILGTVENYV
ncbi:hypothetical protein [Clostridium sp.]|uniref:hypothetical protein n=1 Tax=Clostridium sp. TaxID=1506 RepID=UPI0026121947|nr:hypothetical protein [uncultured Clostridium sp.]